MESANDIRAADVSDNGDQTTAPIAPPTAGRRAAVRLLGLGMALFGALGLHTTAATPEPHSSQAEMELAATTKPRRGKRGRQGRKGARGPHGLGGEPGGNGSQGPQGPAGPSSGAFLGLVRDSKSKEVQPGVLDPIILDCPPAAPGERVVAISGGFDAQVLADKGFFMTSVRPESDTRWIVGVVNVSSGPLTIVGHIVCARFTA